VDAAGNSYGFTKYHGVTSVALDPNAHSFKGVVNEQFLGINDAGMVAGFYQSDKLGDATGFVYNATTGNFTDITMAGATSLTATDINNKGVISGFFTAGGNTDGFVDVNGTFTVLTGPAGASNVNALGLNDQGLVVGSYQASGGNIDGFVYNMANGTYTTVVDPSATTQTVINGINDQGQMVGFYLDSSNHIEGMAINPGPQAAQWNLQTVDNPTDTTFNQLLAINNAGTIAGYYGIGSAAHPNQGYTVTVNGTTNTFTSENFPSSVQTQVTGINNAGQTSGFEVDSNGNSYGFVAENGHYTVAIDPNAPAVNGVVNEQFLGMNDAGQVAGFFTYDTAGDNQAFVYDSHTGDFAAITMAGVTNISATAVSDGGAVVGFFTQGGNTDGFLQAGGKTTILTGPTGASNVQALGVNDAGLVVGSYQDGSGSTHGFVFNSHSQSYTTINDPSAHGLTVVNGINDQNQIVGFYEDGHNNVHGMLGTLKQGLGFNDLASSGSTSAMMSSLVSSHH
jgi:hypothetical protein